MLTADQLKQERIREKKRQGRRTVKHMIVFALVVAIGVTSFVTLDIAYAPIVATNGKILGKKDMWSLKEGSRCEFFLDTGFGPTTYTSWHECKSEPWRVGQRLALRMRKGRITGWHLYGELPRRGS